MWRELTGTRHYKAGSSGTVTIPSDAIVTKISARSTAGGSVVIFGGDSIPVVATTEWNYQAYHDAMRPSAGAADIVFTTTSSYFVEYFTNP